MNHFGKFTHTIVLLFLLTLGTVLAQSMLTAGERVNINTATPEELLSIPGVGEKIADEIMEYRPFTSLAHFEGEIGKYLDEAAIKELEMHITLGLANLNTATPEELASLPGMGENLADEVLEYRPLVSVEQLREELGKYVDAEAIANIEAISTIGLVNVNTASVEELMSIPGVGEKIADEILEYRPFTSIEQFRAELGKYVDEQAVHAIELYLTLE